MRTFHVFSVSTFGEQNSRLCSRSHAALFKVKSLSGRLRRALPAQPLKCKRMLRPLQPSRAIQIRIFCYYAEFCHGAWSLFSHGICQTDSDDLSANQTVKTWSKNLCQSSWKGAALDELELKECGAILHRCQRAFILKMKSFRSWLTRQRTRSRTCPIPEWSFSLFHQHMSRYEAAWACHREEIRILW